MKIAPLNWWIYLWKTHNYCGLFRNKPGIKPGRWGFYILGLEIGSRNPGNRFGIILKNFYLWPY